jgi:hypothetical protein
VRGPLSGRRMTRTITQQDVLQQLKQEVFIF